VKAFSGKTAVVTGGASGIGYAIAERCAKERMNLVVADIEEAALRDAVNRLKAQGARVLGVGTDVSKAEDVEALAQKTLDAFGAVHLLFNNAGVDAPGTIWTRTLSDWQWTIGVNLWGVIHGVRVFVPLMLKQEAEGHVVNTASMGGLTSGPGMGIYRVTKHGVVALSETLYHELRLAGSKVNVSVLCPGFVDTRIGDAARNRPAALRNDSAGEEGSDKADEPESLLFKTVQKLTPPAEVATRVFDAIVDEKFYIITHPDLKQRIKARMEDILLERNPTNPYKRRLQ
jgi:NAD(P)-dependent dehydrogenase (short-subunit alcohol dehydrogenase family)